MHNYNSDSLTTLLRAPILCRLLCCCHVVWLQLAPHAAPSQIDTREASRPDTSRSCLHEEFPGPLRWGRVAVFTLGSLLSEPLVQPLAKELPASALELMISRVHNVVALVQWGRHVVKSVQVFDPREVSSKQLPHLRSYESWEHVLKQPQIWVNDLVFCQVQDGSSECPLLINRTLLKPTPKHTLKHGSADSPNLYVETWTCYQCPGQGVCLPMYGCLTFIHLSESETRFLLGPLMRQLGILCDSVIFMTITC